MPTWMVIMTSVDPQTRESVREVYEVTPPPSPGTEHAVLVQLVAGIYPDAIERAHDGDIVRFEDAGRTITASYEVDGSVAPIPMPPEQGSLFGS